MTCLWLMNAIELFYLLVVVVVVVVAQRTAAADAAVVGYNCRSNVLTVKPVLDSNRDGCESLLWKSCSLPLLRKRMFERCLQLR
jgi:hypothetical protein